MRRRVAALLVGAIAVGACSSTPNSADPADDALVATATPSTEDPASDAGTLATLSPGTTEQREDEDLLADVDEDDVVVIDATQAGREIDRRVFGVNVPAWLGPDRLADPAFIAETAASGATLIRMPGGSWSNSYRWEACEQRDDERCYWPWAARPSDFAGYLRATGLQGMWTVSINESAETAAAAVAFFNGAVDDERPIGVDRDGVDWGTVGRWASLRAEGGHPDPVRIDLWEVGNEVFGGRPEFGGAECASFGWEEVWTCDGREYVHGVDGHDGYLAIRSAMIAVDPEIAVGAVGVAGPSEWSGWGDEVIDESGDALDFYVVHGYGFDQSPSPDEAVRRPGELWPDVVDSLSDRLDGTPLAITEYNLVSFVDGDPDRTMRAVMNAFFIAESLGRMVADDVPIAAMWTLASGTDYALVDADEGFRYPTFDAFRIWAGAGTHRLDPIEASGVRVYPTRVANGRWAIILINVGDASTLFMRFDGLDGTRTATLSGVSAPALTDWEFAEIEPLDVHVEPDTTVRVNVPAVSITVLELP